MCGFQILQLLALGFMYELLQHSCRFDAVLLGGIRTKHSKIIWFWEEIMAQVDQKNPSQTVFLTVPLAAEGAPPCLTDGCHPLPKAREREEKKKIWK